MTPDTLIRNALLFDGTGAAPCVGDLAITGETITAMGDLHALSAPVELDAKGLALTPGFIDAHTHSDVFILIEPDAPSKLAQGVTTEIFGQCGGAAAPRLNHAKFPSDWEAVLEQVNAAGANLTWETVAQYRACFEAAHPAINGVLFSGHNTIRKGVMGDAPRAATPDEVKMMCRVLAQALDEGAHGLSTGLVYHPGLHATPEEVTELVQVCADHDAMYATHMRSESARLLEAVDEVLTLARTTGVRVQISHLKTSGKSNWHKIDQLLTTLNAARAEGLPLHSDRYPYLAAGTDLDIVLPDWAAAGGNPAILQHLDDLADSQRIAAELDDSGRDPHDIMIGGVGEPSLKALSGKTIAELMTQYNCTMGQMIVRILTADRSRTGAFFFGMCHENLLKIYQQPWIMPGSDASLRAPWGILGRDYPHPRAYGTHPEFFHTLTRDCAIAPEEAIRRMTSLPAETFGLHKRGVLREGYAADLVLLDLKNYASTSTYAAPHSFAKGVHSVWVNGSSVFSAGTINPATPRRGKLL